MYVSHFREVKYAAPSTAYRICLKKGKKKKSGHAHYIKRWKSYSVGKKKKESSPQFPPQLMKVLIHTSPPLQKASSFSSPSPLFFEMFFCLKKTPPDRIKPKRDTATLRTAHCTIQLSPTLSLSICQFTRLLPWASRPRVCDRASPRAS